jgi:hypothetical protein
MEPVVRAVGYPRAEAGTFFNQRNFVTRLERIRKMDCKHRPAKTRAHNRDIYKAMRLKKNRLFLRHNN